MKRGRIFCWLIVLFTCIGINAQDVLLKQISIDLPPTARKIFLDTIQKKTGYTFLYSSIVEPERIVDIPSGSYSVKALLDSIFKNQHLAYIVREHLIILSPQSVNTIKEEKLIVEGQVFSRRQQAIPFATIFFESHSRGTIANAEGEFRFLIPVELSKDTLTITCLGYEEVKIPPSTYLTQKLNIQLRNRSIPIKEVVVRREDAEEIVMKSFQNISKNHPVKVTSLTAFFREASKQNSNYISLTEALIEINKSSYSSQSDDIIRLVKGRSGTNTHLPGLVNLVVEGGLYNGIRLDIAKYNTDFYGENALQYYNFKIIRSISFQGRHTYVIGFNAKSGISELVFTGKLYIDAELFALVRAEFEISQEGLQYARNILIKKIPRGYDAKPVHARYDVEYRYYNNSWNLYYARSDLGIKVKKQRGKENKGFVSDFASTSEFVVTGRNEKKPERVHGKDIVGPTDVLVEQVKNTGSEFWLDDNIILPEEPLLITIDKLQREGVIETTDSVISK